MLTGQECERSRRQQALHCGHSGKSLQRGRRVATGLRGYGACEAAEGVVQKSGAKDESSRSGTLTFNGTHASERGAAARKVEWGPALREFENFVGSRAPRGLRSGFHRRHFAQCPSESLPVSYGPGAGPLVRTPPVLLLRVTGGLLSNLGGFVITIRIPCIVHVSCMYRGRILMCPVHIHQDTSRYIRIQQDTFADTYLSGYN